MITVDLNEQDAKDFVLFRKYQTLFEQLDKDKTLDLQFGKITLNYAFGELQNIVKETMVYKR